jgi:hypothetical protein
MKGWGTIRLAVKASHKDAKRVASLKEERYDE